MWHSRYPHCYENTPALKLVTLKNITHARFNRDIVVDVSICILYGSAVSILVDRSVNELTLVPWLLVVPVQNIRENIFISVPSCLCDPIALKCIICKIPT